MNRVGFAISFAMLVFNGILLLLMATRNPGSTHQLRLVVEIPLFTRVLAPSQVVIAGFFSINSMCYVLLEAISKIEALSHRFQQSSPRFRHDNLNQALSFW